MIHWLIKRMQTGLTCNRWIIWFLSPAHRFQSEGFWKVILTWINITWRRLECQLTVLPNFTNSPKIFHIIKDFNLIIKIYVWTVMYNQGHKVKGIQDYVLVVKKMWERETHFLREQALTHHTWGIVPGLALLLPQGWLL